MGQVLRVRMTGAEAELGRIAAADVAKLLLGTERAVRAAASRIVGRPITTGRWGKLIEQVSSFRFVAIEPGSVVAVLELPDLESADESFELGARHLGNEALDAVMQTITGAQQDTFAAAALSQLADELGIGTRISAVQFVPDDGRPPALLDGSARARLHTLAAGGSEPRSGETVVGTLVEADFEKGTARLRTLENRHVKVTFGAELADDIQEALRETAQLDGVVTYDPISAMAKSVQLQRISRAEQLALSMETGQFWLDTSIEERGEAQGVRPVGELDDLTDSDLSDEEAEAFLAALGADG